MVLHVTGLRSPWLILFGTAMVVGLMPVVNYRCLICINIPNTLMMME
jgi:hypothetical protein